MDVVGDLKGGALTTPIWFGTRPVKDSALPYIPRSLTLFGSLQIFALLFVNFLPLLRGDFNYPAITQAIVMTIVILLSIAICLHTIRFIVYGVGWQKMPQDSDLDLLAAFSVFILMTTYLPFLSSSWLVTLAVCVIAPIVISKALGKNKFLSSEN